MFRLAVPAVFAALTLTLLAVPKADAGNCAHVSYGYVATPSYAPTYQQTYYQPYTVVAPYAVPVAVNSNLFSVAPELATLRVNREIAQEAADKAAQKALDSFVATLKANGLIGLPNPPQPLQPNPNDPGTLARPQSSAGTAAKVQAMVNSKCLSCHNGPAKNGVDLTSVDKLSREQRKEVVIRIMADPTDKDFMPRTPNGKAGTPVAPDELNAAHAFVREAPVAAKLPDVPDLAIPAVPMIPPAKK